MNNKEPILLGIIIGLLVFIILRVMAIDINIEKLNKKYENIENVLQELLEESEE